VAKLNRNDKFVIALILLMAILNTISGLVIKQYWTYGIITWAFVATIVIYILVKIVVSIVVLMLIFLACCLTCCCVMIPYVGTVILLPLWVFLRAWPVYFLGQFGPEYSRFATLGPAGETVAEPASPAPAD